MINKYCNQKRNKIIGVIIFTSEDFAFSSPGIDHFDFFRGSMVRTVYHILFVCFRREFNKLFGMLGFVTGTKDLMGQTKLRKVPSSTILKHNKNKKKPRF